MAFPKTKIKLLQSALKELGLYTGKLDGIPGPLTLEAMNKLEDTLAQGTKPIDVNEQPPVPLPVEEVDTEGSSVAEALAYSYKNEGGYVNHPADKGGPTYKGITIKTLSAYLGKPATATDVKNLKPDVIEKIYDQNYWTPMGLRNVLDQSIATALFDMGILNGPATALKMAQEVLGLKDDGRMGPITLTAINSTTDEKFIPLFINRVNKRFDGIVAANPSQSVFLKGWKNRSARLASLINDDAIKNPAPESPDSKDESEVGQHLFDLAHKVGVKEASVKRMIDWCVKNKPGKNPQYWALFEITKHSKYPRMHIFDNVNKTVESVIATHGTGSDPDHNGLATLFSNVPESHKSCLGIFTFENTYNMSKYGRACRLKGHETTNSNALMRGIVFHGAPYAEEKYVKTNGKAGRSYGCPAVAMSKKEQLIDKLRNGSILLIEG